MKNHRIHTWIVRLLAVLVALFLLLTASGCTEGILGTPSSEPSSQTPVTSTVVVGETLEVHFIDVGNADSILLKCGGEFMLIDAGVKAAADTVVEYLDDRGVSSLKTVIATHADADHIGGMSEVLNSFPVERYIMSTMEDKYTPTTKTYERTIEALIDNDVLVTEAVAGDVYTLGEASVHILGPVRTYDDRNTQSVVCRVDFGDTRFLFTGDATVETEQDMIKAGADLRADFLKVGHHGSRTSSSKEFLDAVDPTFALIPCSDDNSYGHPHDEVMERLEARDIEIYRIDHHGTVVAVSDGKDIAVTTEK